MSYAKIITDKLSVNRFPISPSALILFIFLMTLFRYLNAKPPFSYDYQVYIRIINNLSLLYFSDIFEKNLDLLYVSSEGIVPIELGFVILVKCLSMVFDSPEVLYAVIASASVALRIYVMLLLRVPYLWIFAINIFAITLFESNALRLGLAASILLSGLYNIKINKTLIGFMLIFTSLTFHLQIAIFVLPFLAFYFVKNYLKIYKSYLFSLVIIFIFLTLFLLDNVNFIPNEKISVYLNRGYSGSAGLSITSALSIGLLASSIYIGMMDLGNHKDEKFVLVIQAACIPSLILFVFATNMAAIGDRAWQLAFVIFSSFFFLDWTNKKRFLLPYGFFVILSSALVINVTYRYPLSDFFSPPFKSIDFIGYY